MKRSQGIAFWSAVALFLPGAINCQGAFVFTGTYVLETGTDVLGLNGTAFNYSATISNTVSLFGQHPVFPADADRTMYSTTGMSRVTTLSGTLQAGSYEHHFALQNDSVIDFYPPSANGVDSLFFGGSQFLLQGTAIGDPNSIYLEQKPISVVTVPQSTSWFTTLNAPDPFPSIQPADVLNPLFVLGINTQAIEVRVSANGVTTAAGYRIDNLQLAADSTAVPEPSTLTLTGIGCLVALGWARRRNPAQPSSTHRR